MRVFDLHMLGGADWKICTAKMGTTRSAFFHQVYEVLELRRGVQEHSSLSLVFRRATSPAFSTP
jgi:hypothetical protein